MARDVAREKQQGLSESECRWIATYTGPIENAAQVQTLWAGYGMLWRLWTQGISTSGTPVGTARRWIVKKVTPPPSPRPDSPEGRSYHRKVNSYAVERTFYADYAPRFAQAVRESTTPWRIPRAHGAEQAPPGLLLLDDLAAQGFRCHQVEPTEAVLSGCLQWLAWFHATFWRVRGKGDAQAPWPGLWSTGTYWHLATRPDELARTSALLDGGLRRAAAPLDAALAEAPFQTLVHGDAKLANFCVRDGEPHASSSIAAVDFQYVGGGPGIRDVVYFISSVLDEVSVSAYARRADTMVDAYFRFLREALSHRGVGVEHITATERCWRSLYDIAWADFVRFLAGWRPDHWKVHAYSRAATERALKSI